MTKLGRIASVVSVYACLMIVASVSQGDTRLLHSFGLLGHGQLKAIQWKAWAEVKAIADNRNGAEETCVTLAILEPREGSESTSCGSPSKVPFGEVTHTPYGVVAASMFSPRASRVAIKIKGRTSLRLKLKSLELRVSAGRPTHAYSYFAHGFGVGSCLTRITAFDREGRIVSRESNGDRCL